MSNVANSTNIMWHDCPIQKQDRQQLLQQKGCVIWLTGLSGSGLWHFLWLLYLNVCLVHLIKRSMVVSKNRVHTSYSFRVLNSIGDLVCSSGRLHVILLYVVWCLTSNDWQKQWPFVSVYAPFFVTVYVGVQVVVQMLQCFVSPPHFFNLFVATVDNFFPNNWHDESHQRNTLITLQFF